MPKFLDRLTRKTLIRKLFTETLLAPLARIKKKEDVIEKEILKHVQGYTDKGMLTRQALLLEISFVEEIDKTSVGKINKKGLREKYLD